jgi:hypothetical protein
VVGIGADLRPDVVPTIVFLAEVDRAGPRQDLPMLLRQS